jgi:O-antigen ligase
MTTILARSPSAPTRWRAVLPVLAVFAGALAGLDPLLAIAATVAVAYVALVFADLMLGVLLFCGVCFVDVLLGAAGELSFAKAAGLLLALSWLATIATRRSAGRFSAVHPRATYAMILLVLWATLSILWSEDSGLASTTVSRYALNLLLVPIVFAAVRTRRDVVLLLSVFIAGTVLSAGYGLIGRAEAPAGTGAGLERLGGAGVNANVLASLLIAGAILALALAQISRRSPVVRLAALAAAAFCGVSIVFTVSRSGILSLAVAIVAGLLLAGHGRRIRAFGAGLVLAAVVVTYFAAFAPLAATERITTPETGSGREDLWLVGWRMAEAHPVQGVGAGNFPVASIHYLLQPGAIVRDDYIVQVPKVAHNIYLGTLAELGVIGLALFCGILAFALACAARAARTFEDRGDRDMGTLSRAVLIALIAILTANVFASEQFNKPLWILLALCPALLALSRRGEARS